MNNNNNNKQPLDLTESLLVFDKAQAPSNTIPTVNKLDHDGISLVGTSSRDVKQREKNDSLGISGINQPDVTTGNLSRSDELTIDFLLDCAKRGQNRGNQRRPPPIGKVSRILRDLSKSSYKPQLVSIGPIHREDKKLQKFEWLKECYLDDILNRFDSLSTPKKTLLETCLGRVKTKIPKIRESYAGVKKNYSDVELARMMVMDGCFILEFCFKHEDEDLYLQNKMQNTRIALDLMLLENQVPFSVLQALFDCLMGKFSFTLSQVLDTYLAPYIKLFRSDLLPEKISTTDVDSNSTHDHVLGYLHTRYQLLVSKSSNREERIENTTFCGHSIVELDRSGMNFKPHQKNEWLMAIIYQSSPPFAYLTNWFGSKATLLMPTLVIDDTSELILRNFIAYEQSFPQDRYYFTSYAHAMDKLIDSKEDIAKLVESEVLVNNLGSNKEAADMINKVCKNISITDFYYTQEFKQLDSYYTNNIAQLKRLYFGDPWSFIKIILFYLTVVQTFFTIKAAFSGRSNK